MRLSDYDADQIVKFTFDEKLGANKVVLVGGENVSMTANMKPIEDKLDELVKLQQKYSRQDINIPTWPEIQEKNVFIDRIKEVVIEKPTIIKEIEYKTIEVPKVIKEIEYKEIQVPFIVKELEIQKIEIPVVLKEIEYKTIEVPKVIQEVVYKEIQVPFIVKELEIQKIEVPIIVYKEKDSKGLPLFLKVCMLIQALGTIGIMVANFAKLTGR